MGRAVCENMLITNYTALTLIVVVSRKDTTTKMPTWLYRVFASIGLVAQHTPSERDIVSGCTKWISAESCAVIPEEDSGDTHLHFPATVLCKRMKPK